MNNQVNIQDDIQEDIQEDTQEETADGFFGLFAQLAEIMPEQIKMMDVYEDFYTKIYDYMVGAANYDINVYLEAAGEGNKDILEFACGSGRLIFPLVMGGNTVTGIDLSNDMLTLLKKKMVYQSPEIKKAVKFLQGDMTAIDLEKKFDMVILGACTLCLLETPQLKKAFFQNAAKHLKPDGIFMFDYQVYDYDSIAQKNENIDFKVINAAYPKHVMFMGEKLDTEEHVSIVNFYNEIIEEDGKTMRYLGKTRKSLVNDDEVERLIAESGMKIVHSFLREENDPLLKGIRHIYCRLEQ